MYLHLSSNDSKSTHPDNKPFEFTVNLPRNLILNGAWEIALTEIYFQGKSGSKNLYIFTDICESSYVADTFLPLLRIVKRSGPLDIPYYIKLSQDFVSELKVYIRTDGLKEPSFLIGTLRCTLHLRPI